VSIATHLDWNRGNGIAHPAHSADASCNATERMRGTLDSTLAERCVQNIAPSVFIHSSWRTSSTWFWQSFRRLPAALCFYEPFNEGLAALTRSGALQHGPQSWNSGHPKSEPYFFEYAPLLRNSAGVRIYQTQMAIEWYLPPGGLSGDLRPPETKYLSLLLRYAARLGRTPVLGFTRSLGRLAAVKKQFGGIHIFLYRNLWRQWMSYLSQKEAGNPFFYHTLFRICKQKQDNFLNSLYNYYFTKAIELCLSKAATEQIVLQRDNFESQMFLTLPDHDVFTMFMSLHIYLYLHAQQHADILVDVTRMASDRCYREEVEEAVRVRTNLR
jgi:hypothetical protein